MPIVLISTYDATYPRLILQEILSLGAVPEAIFLGSKSERTRFQLASFRRIRRAHGIGEVVRRFLDRRKERTSRNKDFPHPSLLQVAQHHGIRVIFYDWLNSGRMILDLMELRNEVTILGGCGIVNARIAAAARLGCINGHPALLPGARGVDVIEWSLLKGYPLGVTAHLVVPAVDAGDILKTATIDPQAGESFADFKCQVETLQAKVVAVAAVELLSGKALPLENDLTNSSLFHATNHTQRAAARKMYVQRQTEVQADAPCATAEPSSAQQCS